MLYIAQNWFPIVIRFIIMISISFYLKIVRSKLYYHRHIWIRYNLRIDTTELLMYFSFSVPKIEKSTEKSNFLIFRENIFFPFQFFLLFDFVNQKCFHVWSCINFSAYFSYFYCWNIDLGNGKPYSNVVFLEDSWWCSNTMNLGLGVSKLLFLGFAFHKVIYSL